MSPDKHKKTANEDRKPAREEFEVAYYTKELGRPLQRKLLQRRFVSDFQDSSITAANHHADETPADDRFAPPREDRAG
jgi:hypothetical protein